MLLLEITAAEVKTNDDIVPKVLIAVGPMTVEDPGDVKPTGGVELCDGNEAVKPELVI